MCHSFTHTLSTLRCLPSGLETQSIYQGERGQLTESASTQDACSLLVGYSWKQRQMFHLKQHCPRYISIAQNLKAPAAAPRLFRLLLTRISRSVHHGTLRSSYMYMYRYPAPAHRPSKQTPAWLSGPRIRLALGKRKGVESYVEPMRSLQ